MANIKSAKKRINTIDRRNSENKFVKSTLATYTKTFKKLLTEGNFVEAEKQLKVTLTYADSACSKGIIHKNHADRIASRLSSALDKSRSKQAVSAPVVSKVETKVEAPKTEEIKEVVEKPAKKTVKKTEKAATEKAVKKVAAKKEKSTK